MDINGTWLKEKKTHVGESYPKQISPSIQFSMVVHLTQTVCYRNALYLVLQPEVSGTEGGGALEVGSGDVHGSSGSSLAGLGRCLRCLQGPVNHRATSFSVSFFEGVYPF